MGRGKRREEKNGEGRLKFGDTYVQNFLMKPLHFKFTFISKNTLQLKFKKKIGHGLEKLLRS